MLYAGKIIRLYQTRPVGPLQPQLQGQNLLTSQLRLWIWKPIAGSRAKNMETNVHSKKVELNNNCIKTGMKSLKD